MDDILSELSNYKHIEEISEEDRDLAKNLAEEIKTIVEKWGLMPLDAARPQMERVKSIREQLRNMGFLTIITRGIDMASEKLNVEVSLHALKFNHNRLV